MKISKLVATVDSHTCGEPTRIVLGGAPVFKGSTMAERWKDFCDNHNEFRRFIMEEPRGHADMFGAIMVPPIDTNAHTGVIFCDSGGSVSMCGHGSIGLSSALVNLGMVPVVEPVTEVRLDTPAGPVKLDVEVENGEAVRATLKNVPSFVYAQGLDLHLPSLGRTVKFDISFGGSFFAILDAEDLGFEIVPEETSEILALGIEVIREANMQHKVQHPLIPQNNKILLAELGIHGKGKTARNCVIFGSRNVDRSPCGTGTSAMMALLAAKGELAPGEPFPYRSILGTVFEGHYERAEKVGTFDAIQPYVKGSANIVGFNWLIKQDSDPLYPGFLLG
ncbi:proline racemase family protein [Synergistaceae bacterium OttesenSCG-928-I11]|nr:proline racemase family protein [Synergistaceae bacterium OttesenSCG-928-I11]